MLMIIICSYSQQGAREGSAESYASTEEVRSRQLKSRIAVEHTEENDDQAWWWFVQVSIFGRFVAYPRIRYE